MLELVGNPEDRFSQNEAHTKTAPTAQKIYTERERESNQHTISCVYTFSVVVHKRSLIVRKPGLGGFRPGLTQTGCTVTQDG